VTRIAIVDHGAGNLVSIARGLAAVGADPVLVDAPGGLVAVAGIVLPGVGSAAATYRRLADVGFVGALRAAAPPLLGVCVGLQLLFDGSDEGDADGLGIVPGRVRRLGDAPRLPHIGWNDLTIHRPDPLLAGIRSEDTFYFVHSYAPVPQDPSATVATARHGTAFTAVARRGRVAGVQFHPERSGAAGLRVLANFVAACREAADAA
jgi:glutamine amidotransferase